MPLCVPNKFRRARHGRKIIWILLPGLISSIKILTPRPEAISIIAVCIHEAFILSIMFKMKSRETRTATEYQNSEKIDPATALAPKSEEEIDSSGATLPTLFLSVSIAVDWPSGGLRNINVMLHDASAGTQHLEWIRRSPTLFRGSSTSHIATHAIQDSTK